MPTIKYAIFYPTLGQYLDTIGEKCEAKFVYHLDEAWLFDSAEEAIEQLGNTPQKDKYFELRTIIKT